VLLPMVSPASGQAIWGELLQKLSTPSELSWPMQSYLLPKIARLRSLSVGQAPDVDIRRWLKVPADKFGELLSMSLSQGYQVSTALELLQTDKANLDTVASSLVSNPNLSLSVIQQLLGSNEGKTTAHELFALLVTKSPSANWLSDVIKLDPPVSAPFLNHVLGVALDQGKPAIDPFYFIKQHGSALLERLGGQGNLDRLAAQVLDGQAGELLRDDAMKQFFVSLEGKAGISGPVQERLSALLKVQRYLEQPTVRPDQLDAIAKAMQLEPKLFGPATSQQLLRAALSSMGGSTFQDDLVGLTAQLGTDLQWSISSLPGVPETLPGEQELLEEPGADTSLPGGRPRWYAFRCAQLPDRRSRSRSLLAGREHGSAWWQESMGRHERPPG
jgi:hypothetical protein